MSPPPHPATVPPLSRASTSTNTQHTLPASYHPQPRPHIASSFQRADIYSIKQELHDALGEDGLPYWKAMNGYLLGQVGREELAVMVKGWLKGKKLGLHNRLLLSLLQNASSPPISNALASPLNHPKRKRLGPDDPEYDTDETFIEPRASVQHWMMGISGRERARMRRAVVGRASETNAEGEDENGQWGDGGKKKWSGFKSYPSMPPLALSARQLPSSHQLSHHLSQLAKAHDLALAPDAANDIGEFMAVGIDAHLSDLLHGVVHLIGHERPGVDTVRIPPGLKREPGDRMSVDGDDAAVKQEEGELPIPELETFQSLFTIAPGLHPQASPALYKLATSLTRAEAEYNSPVKLERKPSLQTSPPPVPTGISKFEAVSQKLLETGLLKIDKAGRQSEGAEGDGKKDRKHNLHWKYEDPAIILKDMLG